MRAFCIGQAVVALGKIGDQRALDNALRAVSGEQKLIGRDEWRAWWKARHEEPMDAGQSK